MNERKTSCESKCEGGKCIKGVVCDVKNCAYHADENHCYAGMITVGPREASCSANTNCATFKPKEN